MCIRDRSTTVSTSGATANQITISDHTFETGDVMTYDATTLDATATAVGGLTSGNTYYAIYIDKDTIKAAASLSDANAGTAVTLSSSGNGSMFFLGATATGTVQQSAGAITGVTVTSAGSGYGISVNVALADSGTGAGGQVTVITGRSIQELLITTAGTYLSLIHI